MKIDRSRWEIILDILRATNEDGKVKKTRIMQKAYLEFRSFSIYLDFLQAEGFITNCYPDPEYYELTENGQKLFNRLKKVSEIRQPFPIFTPMMMIKEVCSVDKPTQSYYNPRRH